MNISYKVYIILLALLCSNTLIAQSVKDIVDRKIETVYSKTVDNRKNQKSIKHLLTQYDKHGNIIESIERNDDSIIVKWEKFKYNKHNDEIELQSLDTAGKTIKTISTSYDKWNQETEKLTTDVTGKLLEKVASTYNAENDKITETTTDKNGNITRRIVYEYDNKGLIKCRRLYDEKGELVYSKEYTYN